MDTSTLSFRPFVRSALVLGSLMVTLLNSARGDDIAWTSFVGYSFPSDSVAFKDGSVEINFSMDGVASNFASPNTFATDSAQYSNIDTLPYTNLVVTPSAEQTGSPWSIEFDFTGTTMTPADAVNVGQLFRFVNTANETVKLTTFVVTAFAADDVTPYDRNDLDFEQHALDAAGFNAALIWDPATGDLRPEDGISGQENSRWGFFSPSVGEIGRIVFDATTLPNVNGDSIQFGLASTPPPAPVIPLPAAWLLALPWVVGIGIYSARRRMA